MNQTSEATGNIMGKRVHLTLGRSQLEFEQANCGIFLYWHGRLIEVNFCFMMLLYPFFTACDICFLVCFHLSSLMTLEPIELWIAFYDAH